jgi:amino acid transporter
MTDIQCSSKSSTAQAGHPTVSPSFSDSSGPIPYHSNNSVAWVMTDYDATAHIAEEIKDPAIKAPVAIMSALGTTYVLGFFLNIVFCVAMGDWSDLLSSPTGLPAGQIFYNVLGKNGGITFMVLSAVICNFTGATALQAQGRTLFALARGFPLMWLIIDEMLPFSKQMHKIWPRTQTPVIAVWVNVIFCACLGLIDLANYTAISAIFNVILCPHLTLGLRNCNGLELLYSHSLQGNPRQD